MSGAELSNAKMDYTFDKIENISHLSCQRLIWFLPRLRAADQVLVGGLAHYLSAIKPLILVAYCRNKKKKCIGKSTT